MLKRKLSTIILAATITNLTATPINVFAETLRNTTSVESKQNEVSKVATINKFSLYGREILGSYNEIFKMDNSNIASITNNGGRYGGSTIDKAIDENFSTHWETGTSNGTNFTNEVIVSFNEVETLNRIVYAARQDGAKGKGFAQQVELYVSTTESGEDFELVCDGEYLGSTGDVVEIKFNPTEFKRAKFVFKKANQGWASASEFMFYKEDSISDKMSRLFTDETLSAVSEEFNSIEKINALDEEVKAHPLYSDFKENIENAKMIVEKADISYIDASVSILGKPKSEEMIKYDEAYKISLDKVTSITTNGGHYSSSSIDKAMDGNFDTVWHSGRTNNDSFTNEVIITLDELTELNRVVYTGNQGSDRGFAEAFDIYVSATSKGDTFELVTSGTATRTRDLVDIRFNTTEARRIKFVYKKGYENWALASEFGLYRQDETMERMERLFTDSTMSTVSAEFNTIDKITELEEAVKLHPFYERYKENIKNAKILVENSDIEYMDAVVSNFVDKNSEVLPAYDEAFKVSLDKVTSITTNGGQWSDRNIKYAMDGDFSTSWHSGKTNNDSFTNEVEITLDELTELNRVVYTGAAGTNRGFAQAFDIYVSKTSKGNTYELVTSGKATATQSSIEIKFNTTEAKRIKFVFKQGYENWALASEFGLYKEDVLRDKVNNLFVDGTMTALKDEFNSKEIIDDIAAEVENHPLKEILEVIMNAAKKIVNGEEISQGKMITLSQRGNAGTEQRRTQTAFGLYAFDPTGYYVTPGETIKVYVDADPNGPMPQLVFGQIADDKNGWSRFYTLSPGYNEITAQDFDKMAPAAIYFVSNSLPGEQEYAPKVRFEGGTKFPIYMHGKTDPQEFTEELRAYMDEVNFNDAEVAAGNGKYNICEVTSENVIISTSAAGALVGVEADVKNGKNIGDAMDLWEQTYYDFAEMSGYEMEDESDENYRPRGQFLLRVFTKGPFGWGDWGYSGYNGGNEERRDKGFFSSFTSTGAILNAGWAIPHEIGHTYDNGTITTQESTNNLYSLMLQDKYLGVNRMVQENRWEKHFTNYHNTKQYPDDQLFFGAVVYQLYPHFGDKVYGQAQKVARTRRSELGGMNNKQRLAVTLSIATGYNLLSHFEYYGVEMNDKSREMVEGLPTFDKKMYYNNNKSINEEAKAFENGLTAKPVIKVSDTTDTSITLEMSINENDDTLLLYEVYRDGEYLGVTYNNEFVDKNVEKGQTYEYKVIAYDRQLNTSLESDALIKNLNEPKLNVDANITIKLREDFDIINYINATDHEGNDITSQVRVVKGSVDNNNVGVYNLEVEVIDEELKVTKNVKVNVVSNYTYLSDLQEVSHKTGWGSFRKDKNVNGGTISLLKFGEAKTYSKGLGIHANSEIVYNVEGMGYNYFESYIGVDQSMANSKASVTFEVWVDGEKKYDSKIYRGSTNSDSISVDIRDAKEVKLITTDAKDNGNSSDHSIWAEAKFTTSNSKPSLQVEDKTYKIGEEVDFISGITAEDIEDGDLTSNIEIVSNTYEVGKVGRFEVVYRVTDSDNNVVEKSAYVTVYEEIATVKSKHGQFDTLDEYKEIFKIPVASISNNGGNYGGDVIARAIDNNKNTHWETGRENSNSFKNEVIFDLGQVTEIDKIGYAARNGGKGFARKFEIYISTEAEGNDFRLAGVGSYNGSVNDVIEIDITKTEARRVKFKFIEANQNWASIGEMSFYKTDELADKIASDLFVDGDKTEVAESYNTLDKLQALRDEVSTHPAASLFQDALNKAEELIRTKFPSLNIPKSSSTKLGEVVDIIGEYSATDNEDGDITSSVEVSGEVNFDKTGEYTLTYKVTDSDGNVTVKTRTVAVVDMNDFNYLTEYNWKSTNNSYATPKKDISTSGRTLRLTGEDGQEIAYERGIGAHSTSTIIYDLSDKNYDYFTSYVGVDRQMYGSIGSVSFEVYVDGEMKFDSGLMNSRDVQKFVEVDINGASELKLVVTDGGNGNGSDHATWGDAKLHYANTEAVEINRAELDTLIENINGLNSELYTAESFNNLQVVLEEVNTSLADGYNQEEVDILTDKLKQAFESLVLIEVVDYDTLIAKVEEVKAIKEYLYTVDSYAKLKEALIKAEDILEERNSTNEEVEAISNEINSSIESLEVVGRKDKLDEMMEYADTLKDISVVGAEKHKESRWNNFLYGREVIREILLNVNTTSEEVEGAIFQFQYFIDELEIK